MTTTNRHVLTQAPRFGREVEFNVLGPVTVVDVADSLNIGGPKQRTVLAMLIAHAGRPVSADALVEAVYAEDSSGRARRRIQTYVSTLRSVIGDVITKERGGWSLQVDRQAVDALRFEDLYASARDAEDLTAEAVAAVLREALALWRGHPYSDIEANGQLDAEITRLRELRVAVQAARIDSDLAAGRHADLIGEIESLIVEHPYLEMFRAQHMLALYRAGRQKEALRSYGQMRHLLVEELGVDPTEELRELEQRILEQDVSLRLTTRKVVQRKSVMVVDPGDPLELARLPAAERDVLLADTARWLERAMSDTAQGTLLHSGTASYAVFDSIDDAVSTGERVAARLEGLPIRISIDFGDVEVADGSVSGAPVSRAAALAAVAHPGQVLLSSYAQQELVSGGYGAGLRFEALGSFDLVGVHDPVSIYQLLTGDPPKTFPPLVVDRTPPPHPGGIERSVPGCELRDPMGEGSVGTLFLGYQPSLGREVMIEVIGRPAACGPDFIRRFEADAQRLALLDHPNINPLIDYWRDTDGAYLVYRSHRGGFLSDPAGGGAGLDVSPGRVIDQVGAAVAYAHSYGVIHGSLRPDRIALDESGNAFVFGFPLAGARPVLTPDFAAYLAPEQMTGEPATIATDVFALGVLAHELTTGPSLVDSPVRSDVAAISRAVSEDPAQRHSSVNEFLVDLNPAGVDSPESRFTETRNPYKGLTPFHESDAGDFFGRRTVTEALIDSLARARFLAVVGPSGSGKSSVVRAGLIPALRRGAIEGSESWVITDMLPGSHPFLELQRALERVAVELPAAVRERFAERDPGALDTVGRVIPDGSELLLVIDQFEELFTMADDSAATAFLDLLTGTPMTDRTRIVITLRADFLDRPLRYSAFGRLLADTMVTLPALGPDELGEAVRGPVERLGVSVEPALTERIVSEVHDRPGALPLLQHALSALFEARTSDLLTTDAYDHVGGVTGSLAGRAESIYTGFDETQQAAAEQVLLRLVTVADDSAPTRRRVRLTEFGDGSSRSVVEAFARGRLIVFDSDPDTRTPTIEVAHEALLSHWPRLAGWIEATREDLTLARRLEEARSEWEASDRDEAHLLTGGRLAQHEAWTSTTSLALAAADNEYLAASRHHDGLVMASRRRRRRVVMAGFAVAAVIAAVFGQVAWSNARDADSSRIDAQARSLLASATAVMDDDPDLALNLATQGAALLPDDALALEVLRNALRQSRTIYHDPETFGPVGLSPDGTLVAEGGATIDGGIQVRDVDTGELVWATDVAGPEAEPRYLDTRTAFVNDGTELAVSVAIGAAGPGVEPPDTVGLHILDAETGAVLRTYEQRGCGPVLYDNTAVGSLVLLLEVADPDWGICGPRGVEAPPFQLKWLDVNTGLTTPVGTATQFGNPAPQSAVDANRHRVAWFDPDDVSVTVTELATGSELVSLPDLSAGSLALSPDGSWLAVGGSGFVTDTVKDQTLIRIFDVDSGEEIAALEGHGAGVTSSVRFFDSGEALVSVGADGQLKTWDLESGQLTAAIPTGASTVPLVSVSADESRVAVSGDSAKVFSLEPGHGADVATLVSCGMARFYVSRGLQVSGDRVMSQTLCPRDDGYLTMRAYVFALDTLELADTSPLATGQGMAFSADGRFVAGHDVRPPTETTPEMAGPVVVTDLDTGQRVEMDGLCWYTINAGPPEGTDCREPPDEPYIAWADDMDFSADGRMLAIAPQYGGPGRVWDPATGATLASWDFQGVEFSPDSSLVFTWDGLDHELRETGDFSVLVSRELDFEESPWQLAITPDNQTLIGSVEGDLLFYDLETLDVVDRWNDLHEAPIDHMVMSDDASMIATAGGDGYVKVWDLDTGDLLDSIPVAPEERVGSVGFANDDRHVLASTPSGPVRLYTLDVDALIESARARLVRGFTEAECLQYFPESDCPTFEAMKSGQ